jgi:hypothetical protein
VRRLEDRPAAARRELDADEQLFLTARFDPLPAGLPDQRRYHQDRALRGARGDRPGSALASDRGVHPQSI